MKHARDPALDTIEAMLQSLRALDGLVEKKRGVFYRRGQAFLHFHEDPAGMFADVRVPPPASDEEWQRLRATTRTEQRALITMVKQALRA